MITANEARSIATTSLADDAHYAIKRAARSGESETTIVASAEELLDGRVSALFQKLSNNGFDYEMITSDGISTILITW